MRGIIYIYTNILNNKVYIGQTTQEEKARQSQHKTSKDNLPFHCAIRKYGWDNFHYETLKEKIILSGEHIFQRKESKIKRLR